MKIYLVRHGETPWNKIGRIQGSADIPLNELGEQLADITAAALLDVPIEKIYASPLKRAVRTAKPFAESRGLDIITDARLKEMDFSIYEGSNIAGARADKNHPLHDFLVNPGEYRALAGENIVDVIKRARDFIENELRPLEKQHDCILIAAHGAFIRAFFRVFLNRKLSDYWAGIPQKNCAVNLLEMKDGKLTLLEEGRIYYDESLISGDRL